MEFIASVEELTKNLGLLQGISERRATMPILSHVLILASDNKINITSTDLETTLSIWVECEVKKQGSISLPARKMFEILREIEDDKVKIGDIGNNWVEISTRNSTFKIAGLSSEEFPQRPEMASDSLSIINSTVFDDMINKTIFAVSQDELRRNLAGIYFEKVGESRIRLVATDGHRLSMVESEVDNEIVVEKGVVIPRKGVSELRKIIKLSEEVAMGFGKNAFYAKSGNVVLVSRLIDADFPDYKQVTPESSSFNISIGRRGLLNALRRVSLFSSEKTRSIKLKIDSGVMVLSSISPEVGEAEESLEIDFEGGPLELGFNSTYFIEALEVIEEDSIRLGLTDELSPATISAVGNDNYISVIMPMRV